MYVRKRELTFTSLFLVRLRNFETEDIPNKKFV